MRERDLYRDLKARIRTRDDAVKFAADLQRAARLYEALLHPDHETWAELGGGSRDNVETLLRLRLEQHRPLLLAAMERMSKPALRETLRSVVAWSVRGVIVGGIGAGTTEAAYSGAAVKVRNGSISTPEELFKELQAIVPTDEAFRSAFSLASVPSARMARYYLLAFERERIGDAEPELVPNADAEAVNLEHILPRNAKPHEWPTFDEDELKQWINRLGNMVLLRKTQNARLGNKPFEQKRPVLAGSDLQLTKAAADPAEWSPRAIDARQENLAVMAPSIWPRRPGRR